MVYRLLSRDTILADVKAAFMALLAAGDYPSEGKIRDRLGGGSTRRIARAVRTLEACGEVVRPERTRESYLPRRDRDTVSVPIPIVTPDRSSVMSTPVYRPADVTLSARRDYDRAWSSIRRKAR